MLCLNIKKNYYKSIKNTKMYIAQSSNSTSYLENKKNDFLRRANELGRTERAILPPQ